jgi:hypothetical protein
MLVMPQRAVRLLWWKDREEDVAKIGTGSGCGHSSGTVKNDQAGFV